MKKITRNCSCDAWMSWGKRPPEAAQFPPGFCGFCHRCGAPGHHSYHPGPVRGSASWCDRCYLIERHRPGLRKPEAFFLVPGECFLFDEGEEREYAAPFDETLIALLARLLGHFRGDESRLLIKFENGTGVDFWLQSDKTIELSFGDPARKLWGRCIVEPDIGGMIVRAAAAGEDLRAMFDTTKLEVDYFEEYRPSQQRATPPEVMEPWNPLWNTLERLARRALANPFGIASGGTPVPFRLEMRLWQDTMWDLNRSWVIASGVSEDGNNLVYCVRSVCWDRSADRKHLQEGWSQVGAKLLEGQVENHLQPSLSFREQTVPETVLTPYFEAIQGFTTTSPSALESRGLDDSARLGVELFAPTGPVEVVWRADWTAAMEAEGNMLALRVGELRTELNRILLVAHLG